MDQEFESRRCAGLAPFDGVTIAAPDEWPRAPVSWQAIAAIVHWLHARFGDSRLFRIEDWHEHDGWVNTAEPIPWHEVLAVFASTESLVNAGNPDTYVRIGIFPESRDWYLRFCVETESAEVGPVIHFDFTAAKRLAMDVDSMIRSTGINICVSRDPREYFSERFNG